jgi:beta-glucuronidase
MGAQCSREWLTSLAARRPARAPVMPVRSLAAFAASVALVLAAAGGLAHAQGTAPLVYKATSPTAGALYQDGQSGRYLLGGTWLYRPDPADAGAADGWWRNVASTSDWSPVTVPNSYNAGDLSVASMAGSVGWYRRDFTLPKGAFNSYVPAADRRWIVRFESVNYNATVWLNGHKLGTHAGAYVPFEFDLNRLRPGVNRLIVRVDDRRDGADFPPGPSGGWWNFGGLQREVYLRAVQRADLQQVRVRPVLPCPTCASTIQAQALVRNVTATKQQVQLTGTYGSRKLDFGSDTIPPHATWVATADTTIAHPNLWAPGHPALYKARLTLSDAKGRTLGGYFSYSGIRTITVSSDGRLELNGRPLDLRGVSIHEQSVTTGAALSPTQLRQLMSWVRELGADVIRQHYPPNPELEELADKYGILIWSEVPVYQTGKKNLARTGEIQRADALLKDNILTNQNHPSILLWSIANELPSPATTAEVRYIKSATALAHQLDPTRPVGMAVANWPGIACQTAYAPLDVIGLNEYFGWFDENGGATDDQAQLGPYLDSFRACYPKQAIMVTEFGVDANVDGPAEVKGTYEFQSATAAYHLGVFASKKWLSGAIWFALQDFATRPGWSGGNPNTPDPPWVEKGLVDRYGNLKPAFGTVAAIFHATRQIAR